MVLHNHKPLFSSLISFFEAFFGYLKNLQTLVHFDACMFELAVYMKVKELSRHSYLYSFQITPFCASLTTEQEPRCRRGQTFSLHIPRQSKVKNEENIDVLLDSAIAD